MGFHPSCCACLLPSRVVGGLRLNVRSGCPPQHAGGQIAPNHFRKKSYIESICIRKNPISLWALMLSRRVYKINTPTATGGPVARLDAQRSGQVTIGASASVFGSDSACWPGASSADSLASVVSGASSATGAEGAFFVANRMSGIAGASA